MFTSLTTLSQLPVEAAAKRLLGTQLVRQFKGQQLIGRIVEVEAYHEADPASHSFQGITPRTTPMFGPAGRLYVYFTYGMHYCCNVVTGPEGSGQAVLIRALEPLLGQAAMQRNRGSVAEAQLTNGPAKLTQALGIDGALNDHDLSKPPLQLVFKPPLVASQIVSAPRIGISKATTVLARFYEQDNPWVSRK